MFGFLRRKAKPTVPERTIHERWCDTKMPSAAYWAGQGMPFRCNCDDIGPGSFRAVMAAYDDLRAIDLELQQELGITLPPMPSAAEVIDGNR